MRKPSRHLPLLLLVLAALWGCEQELYDTGEGEYSQMRADFAEVHTGSDKYVDYVITDEGDSLRTDPPFTTNWLQTPDSIYRVLLYYNLKDDGKAEAIQVGQVLTAKLRETARLKDSAMTDPVYLESFWMARNRRYVNLRLRVMTGLDATASSGGQVFGLLSDSLTTRADGSRTRYLRLYHNQNGQPEYYSRTVFLSLPTSGLNADTLVLSTNTYTGVVIRKLSIN